MKKKVSVIILVALVLSLIIALTGCGSGFDFIKDAISNIQEEERQQNPSEDGSGDTGKDDGETPAVIPEADAVFDAAIVKKDPMQDSAFRPNLITAAQKEVSPYRYLRDGDVSALQKQSVSTDEELFYALTSGNLPVCVSGSAAEKYYNRMLQVLDNIILNDMSEFDRALAIYDWIIYTVKYDYEIYDQYIENSSSVTGNEAPFRMEGVFDNASAVCDGLSKAFASMCRIEGIACIQSLGKVGDIGHAWNKICIHKPDVVCNANYSECKDETHRQWYLVDPTNGNLGIEIPAFHKVVKEVLVHNAFLIGSDNALCKDYIEDNTAENAFSLTLQTPDDYQSYQSIDIDGGKSGIMMYVANAAQLKQALEYVFENRLTGVELFLAECVLRSNAEMTEYIKAGLPAGSGGSTIFLQANGQNTGGFLLSPSYA